MQKRYIIIILAGTVMALFTAVILFSTRPIKIGAIVTTDIPLGAEEDLSLRFYRDKFPRIGLRPVKYYIENPSLDKEAIQKAFAALEKRNVSIIVGGANSDTGIIIAGESARSGIPVFSFTSATRLLSKKNDNFTRTIVSSDLYGKYTALYCKDEGIKRICVITSTKNRGWSETFSSAVKEIYGNSSMEIEYTSINNVMMTIKNKRCDAILMTVESSQILQVVRAARSHDPSIHLIITPAGLDTLIGNINNPLFNKTVFPSASDISVKNERMTRLNSEFTERNNFTSIVATGVVFRVMDLVYDGIKTNGSSRTRLRSWFNTPRLYREEPAGYTMYIDQYGDAYKPNFYFYEINNGTIRKKAGYKASEFPDEYR